MTIPRKGFRRIVVDGVAYLWKTPRKVHRYDWEHVERGFHVVVQTEDRRGSALSIRFPQRHPDAAALFGKPVVPVLPSQVASAIRRALAAGWDPAVHDPFWFGIEAEAPEAEPGAAADGGA